MTSLFISIGTIVVTIALTIGGMVVFRKLVDVEKLKIDHEVTTALIAVMGTLYAIVLGLVVVDALSHREQAELMESTEANALATVMHLCRTLPVAERRTIMASELDYCTDAVDKEWDMMDKGTAPERDTVNAFSAIWEKVSAFDPQNNRETNLHNCMLTAMTDFSNARRFRIVTCKHGLPFLLWVVLIVGGICTIGFTYFFGAEKPKFQMTMTSIVSFMLCLNVLLVYFYSSPYKGEMRIEPTALEHVRDLLRSAPVLLNTTHREHK
jgi:hypothetical protein